MSAPNVGPVVQIEVLRTLIENLYRETSSRRVNVHIRCGVNQIHRYLHGGSDGETRELENRLRCDTCSNALASAEPHTCPLRWELSDDDSPCTCCADCQEDCSGSR